MCERPALRYVGHSHAEASCASRGGNPSLRAIVARPVVPYTSSMHTTPYHEDQSQHAGELRRSMKGICRIHHHGPTGWRVTLQRQKQLYTRKFSDHRYGGTAEALEAAQTYRDSLLAKHPGMTRRAQCAILKKNNTSGVSGVTRSVVIDCRLKTLDPAVYWVARWPGETGIPTQRRFAVKKYGEWGAFLKAVEARRHGLACLDETPSSSQMPQE